MPNLGMASKVKKKFEGTDPINNINAAYNKLKDQFYKNLLDLSDNFFYYCFLNGLTHETISDKILIDRRKDMSFPV